MMIEISSYNDMIMREIFVCLKSLTRSERISQVLKRTLTRSETIFNFTGPTLLDRSEVCVSDECTGEFWRESESERTFFRHFS